MQVRQSAGLLLKNNLKIYKDGGMPQEFVEFVKVGVCEVLVPILSGVQSTSLRGVLPAAGLATHDRSFDQALAPHRWHMHRCNSGHGRHVGKAGYDTGQQPGERQY
jgi:hypothetical protein